MKGPGEALIRRDKDHPPFSNETRCFVLKLEYDYEKKTGCLWCGGPTDMTGAINTFKAIDQDVQRIITYEDGAICTGYRVNYAGHWQAMDLENIHGQR